MEDTSCYMVIWHSVKKIPRKGILNRILGRYKKLIIPIIHRYDSEEIAEYGFQNIKSNGGYKPLLLKILRE